jgi:hypothetical protein
MDARLRSAATLGVLVMLCLLGILFGVKSLTKDLPANPISAGSDELCTERTVEAGQKIRASEITVSVFNAGTRGGAASKVMKELQTRGFASGDSANAPDGTKVIRAQVWADSRRNSAAQLVAAQFGDDIAVKINRKNIGIGIVVVVGNDLGKLVKAPTSTTATRPTKVCSPPVS